MSQTRFTWGVLFMYIIRNVCKCSCISITPWSPGSQRQNQTWFPRNSASLSSSFASFSSSWPPALLPDCCGYKWGWSRRASVNGGWLRRTHAHAELTFTSIATNDSWATSCGLTNGSSSWMAVMPFSWDSNRRGGRQNAQHTTKEKHSLYIFYVLPALRHLRLLTLAS